MLVKGIRLFQTLLRAGFSESDFGWRKPEHGGVAGPIPFTSCLMWYLVEIVVPMYLPGLCNEQVSSRDQ